MIEESDPTDKSGGLLSDTTFLICPRMNPGAYTGADEGQQTISSQNPPSAANQ